MCLSANPVVVRQTMLLLRQSGLVASAPGHSDDWNIKADLSKVSPRELREALGEPVLFTMGNRHCLVEPAVNAALNDAFDEAEALLLERLASVSLADLVADFARQHKAHAEKGVRLGAKGNLPYPR
ncbi:MAG: Rrf2 family transcriptional regulator [Pseudoxanthomonas sp.]|nr:Rrf2 family transcriptional regulator [Pseudoxanthomonas sp.]